MNNSDVVSDPGFKNMVVYAIKSRHLPFTEDIDEICQEVAHRILLYGPKDKNYAVSTVIISQTIWLFVDKNKSNKKKLIKRDTEFDIPYIEKLQSIIEEKDTVEELKSLATDKQRKVIDLLLAGKTQSETARILGCSKQNISSYLNTLKNNFLEKSV